jgi:hypothetical protein
MSKIVPILLHQSQFMRLQPYAALTGEAIGPSITDRYRTAICRKMVAENHARVASYFATFSSEKMNIFAYQGRL